MSNDVATVTEVKIDASGAKAGADEFQKAGEKVIASNTSMADVIESVTKRIATSTSVTSLSPGEARFARACTKRTPGSTARAA